MKKTVIVLLLGLLVATWAQAETSMEETAQQIHELYGRVEKLGDPRILSTGNLPEDYGKNYAFAMKYLEKSRQLRALRDHFEPFVTQVSQTHAPQDAV